MLLGLRGSAGGADTIGEATMRTRRSVAAVLLAGALLCMSAVGASAAPPTDSSALREAVTLAGVRAH
jgi:hypothetical protein